MIAIFPGSFDPITLGHVEIVERAASLFSEVIVAVGEHPTKQGCFPVKRRCALIEASLSHIDKASASSYQGLLVDYCRTRGAGVIVRGIRGSSDLDAESQMGLANRDLAPEIETIFLLPSAHVHYISSSLIRDIASHGGDIRRYVSSPVAAALAGLRG